MAHIEFSPSARERFEKCKAFTEAKGDKTLQAKIDQLSGWGLDYDGKERGVSIHIGCDFDPLSFSFAEILPDGRTGVCGGIIYHGERDGFGNGSGPTFSVCLEKTEGYQIHT